MSDWKLRLYHRAPTPVRSVAATARGAYLRSWRYSSETDDLAAAALERDTWNGAQWRAWREGRLAFVLQRAATRVPYYRSYWAQRRARGERGGWERLENWPILSKETLREQPHAFVADDCDTRRMFPEHTSGTTGKPLHLWWSRATVREWYALSEARIRHWNGLTRHNRWAILGGQLVVPVAQTHPPFWVWNAALNQLYMSSYHLAPANALAYVHALSRHGVEYLLGYPSAIHALAQFALEQGLSAPRLALAVGNAEPLYQHQHDTIAQAFGCPVRNTYGMAEIVCAASECSSGALHQWPEVGLLEVLDSENAPVAHGETGRFVCTGLLNADMPLVRYEVGDTGALAASAVCPCGRGLPVIASVEGRLDDVVIAADGRRIGRLDPAFKADLRIREAQIIQETLEMLRVLIVPAASYSAADGVALAERLRDRVGAMDIRIELVEAIPRANNGKLRAVISRVRA